VSENNNPHEPQFLAVNVLKQEPQEPRTISVSVRRNDEDTTTVGYVKPPQNVNELLRVYSRLAAMRQNVPLVWADGRRGEEFNELVDRAANVLGEDLSEFRVRPDDSVKDPNREGKIIPAELYSQRLDALMGYIRATAPEPVRKQIGFLG
jgi:hypothetical protein